MASTQKAEVTTPPKFNREREAVAGFVNACCLYTKARLGEVAENEKISWVLSYIQEGMAEVWKDNILEEITEGTCI